MKLGDKQKMVEMLQEAFRVYSQLKIIRGMTSAENYLKQISNNETIPIANKTKTRDSINIDEFLTNLTKHKPGDIFNEQNMLNYIKNCILSVGKVFPGMISDNADYKIKSPNYWGLSQLHKSQLYVMSENIYDPIKKYYENRYIKKLLKNVQMNSTPSILLSNIIPLMEKSTFNTQTSILLMEHCFLTILFEYINLSDNVSMIVDIDVNDENESDEGFTISQSEKDTFKKNIATLLSDYFKIMNNSKENINITYNEIMDNVFKLKEAEKNRMRKRAEDLGKEQLQVDNEFKEHKIGFWSKGEHARHYDGDRFDEEFGIMQDLNEKENRLAKQKNKPKQGVNLQDVNDLDEEDDAQRRIDNEKGEVDTDEDWDDGDYYRED